MPSASPMPKKKSDSSTMSFYDALKLVVIGKKVTRKEWDNTSSYFVMKDGYLKVDLGDKVLHDLILRDVDINSEDWVIVS